METIAADSVGNHMVWSSGFPDNKVFFLFGVTSNKIVKDRLLHKKLAKIFVC